MPNYLNIHKKNIISEIIISKSNLEPGAIIEFTYLDEDKKMSKPLVVVLNPVYHNNLHGIKIDEVMPANVQKLVNEVKLWYSHRLNDKINQRLPLIKVNVGSPKSFYETKLRAFIPRILKTEDCYREYKLNRISALRIIEYRFELKEREDALLEAKKKREKQLMDEAIRKVKARARGERT